MRDADGQRLQLKSKLLVGAAGMTAVAMSTAAFGADAASPAANASAAPAPTPAVAPAATPAQAMVPIDPPKWLPYVDIGGGAGSGFAIGRANAFVPFWQDIDSLAFVRFGAATDSRHNSTNDFNIGAGYRTKIDDEWILGAFAGFDSTQTNYNHTFNQFSFGLEAMSTDWDIRANAYLAKNTNRTIGNKFELYIHDTTIAILQGQEAALSGFDGEVGYRIFNTDSTDVRVFAGAYTFHHSDVDTAGIGTNFSFPYHDVTGPKLRAEVNMFDLDMLGSQSRFSIEGEVSHDNVYHTSEYIGATLRIALNDPSGSGAQALGDLDRRMADPVRRNDNVLTQWNFNKPEPVIIYNSTVTSKPTNTLYYAEQRSGAGAGTDADPTTIQDATSRGAAGKNAFIVLTDAGGSAIDATGTTVQSGETLTGAGTFKVRGESTTYPVFTHDFAPGSGAVSLGTTSGNVLTIDGDANIAGFSIVGPFVDGIYGANVGNVTISNITIDGPGTNGMVFKQTNTSGTSNIVIKNSSIAGVTNDGVDLSVSATSGGTSTTNLVFSNGAIHAGNHGVDVVSTASGLSTNATVYANIHNSTLTTGGTGAEMAGTTSGGGTLTQTLLVDPTTIHSSAHYGIYVHANISGGTLTQNLAVDDVALTGTTDVGLAVYAHATGGHLIQNVSVDNLTITGAALPVAIYASGAHGAQIDQSLDLTNVEANNATYAGISIRAVGDSGASVHQTATLTDIRASDAGEYGVSILDSAKYGATAIQTVNISDLTANNNGVGGVFAYVIGYGPTTDAPSVAAQYITVDQATLTGNGLAGVSAEAIALTNTVVRQDVNVLNATISGSVFGVGIGETALGGASVQQNIYLANDSITHNTGDGIYIASEASGSAGFAAQYGTIYSVDVSNNGRDGIFIGAYANAADVEQQIYMNGITADHEGRDGIEIRANSTGYTTGSYTTYPAHVEQDFYVVASDLSHNARNGLEIYNTASDRAQIDQTIFVYGSHMDDNAVYGLYEQSYVHGPASATYANGQKTVLNSNLYVEGSTADHNGLSGIYIYTYAGGAGVQTQHITIEGTDVSYNGGAAGLVDVAYATGYLSENLHYITITGSTFDHNTHDGADLIASQVYGPGPYGVSIQFATISDSDFSHNAGDGLLLGAYAYGYNGRAEQYITISGSNFSHNGGNGIDSRAYAGGGGYVPGYSCLGVQGTVGYCAVVRESLSVDSSTINDNAKSGIYVGSVAFGYGAIYSHSGRSGAPSLYVSNSTISGNAYAGIALYNYEIGFSYLFQYAVIDNTKITGNGTDGSYFASVHGPSMIQGGITVTNGVKYASTQEQFITIEGGSDISDNKGFGISVETSGYKALDITNVLQAYNSTVDGNYGGALMVTFAIETYGDVTQAFYSYKSHFDNNVGGGSISGPFKYSGAGVLQSMFVDHATGAAYQYFGSVGSTFSGNYTSGAVAEQFVKYVGSQQQTVTSSGDTFSGNGYNGLTIGLESKYNSGIHNRQDVSISGGTFDNNAYDGLSNRVTEKYGTYLTQTVSVADTAMDNNHFDGFDSYVYVDDGSFLQQKIKFYSYHGVSSASGNGGYGVSIQSKVANGSDMYSHNYVDGVTISSNGDAGLLVNGYGSPSAVLDSKYYINGNTITGNSNGIELNSGGSGSFQLNYLTNNTVTGNSFYGVRAYAGNGGFQYTQVYTGGNSISGNSPNYGFVSAGGSTQLHD